MPVRHIAIVRAKRYFSSVQNIVTPNLKPDEVMSSCQKQDIPEALIVYRGGPIHRLPLELLMVIFSFCISRDRIVWPSPTHGPLLLVRICSAWREIVLSMPKMWSSIYLDIRSKQCGSKYVEMVDTWLGRSGNCPLSLTLVVFWSRSGKALVLPDACADTATKITALYFRYVQRWQHVRFIISATRVFKTPIPFEVCGNIAAPMLESLAVETSKLMHLFLWRPLNIVLRSVPRLCDFSFSIQDSTDAVTSSVLHPPYSQLTHLDLNTFDSFGDVLNVLRASKNLVEYCLTLEFDLQYSVKDPELVDVIHPSLRFLRIDTEWGLSGILDHLILPSLRYLAVDFNRVCFDDTDEDVIWPQSEMTSFLTRSSCPVEELLLINSAVTKDDLIKCLEHTTSSLTNILVHNDSIICVTDAVLARLSRHGQTSFLCPKLACMEFTDCDSFSDGALADMVESRWESSSAIEATSSAGQPVRCTRLKSITFELVDIDRNTDDVRRLGVLQGKGLHVDVR